MRPVECHGPFREIPPAPLFAALVRQARRRRSLGVRATIYPNPQLPENIAGRLRRLGIACKRRQQTVLVYTKQRDLASPDRWRFSDDMRIAFHNA